MHAHAQEHRWARARRSAGFLSAACTRATPWLEGAVQRHMTVVTWAGTARQPAAEQERDQHHAPTAKVLGPPSPDQRFKSERLEKRVHAAHGLQRSLERRRSGGRASPNVTRWSRPAASRRSRSAASRSACSGCPSRSKSSASAAPVSSLPPAAWHVTRVRAPLSPPRESCDGETPHGKPAALAQHGPAAPSAAAAPATRQPVSARAARLAADPLPRSPPLASTDTCRQAQALSHDRSVSRGFK